MGRRYQNLAEYLEKEGVTQEQFAERLEVSQAHVSRIVNRQMTPSLELAVRIAREANIPVESLDTSEVA